MMVQYDYRVPAPVEALAVAWREWSREPGFPFSPDHCVNGTRVAIHVLRRFGVKARPASVEVRVYNDFAFGLWLNDVPAPEWPPYAWAVGVGCPEQVAEPGRFAGHLVAAGDGFVLDLSAGQFHRPGRIALDGPAVFPAGLPPDGQWLHVHQGDVHYLLARAEANNAWRQAPGWRRHPVEAAEAETRARARLERGG